jgi:Transposase DDE domain
MCTLPQLAHNIKTVLTRVADGAAVETGFVQRTSKLSGATFVQTLTFGWLDDPAASLDALTRTAASLHLAITPQGLDQRFSAAGAHLLERVLASAVQQVVQTESAAVPLLQRFHGVYLLDSTQIALPPPLASEWPGCGGGQAPADGLATLKLQVRLNFSSGELQGPWLQAGRTSDRNSPTQHEALPAGALRLADLGYFSLEVLQETAAQGAYWLTRVMAHTRWFAADGREVDLPHWLAGQATGIVDCPMRLGAHAQLPCRLIALRVPPAVARARRRALRKEARRKGQAVSPERLRLAGWTIFATNLSPEQLSWQEAWVLARLRWQIELLFKLWKSQGHVDESRSAKPWRILCEVYAKLLGLVVQHWLVLTATWARPDRSLVKAGQTVRAHALHLASAFAHSARAFGRALETVQRCLASGCRVNRRKKHPSAFQLWLEPKRVTLT